MRSVKSVEPSMSTVGFGVLRPATMSMLSTARSGRGRWTGGDVLLAAVQALFLAAEEDEPKVVADGTLGEHAGDLEQPRAAAAVVIGTRSRCVGAGDVHRVEVGHHDHQRRGSAPTPALSATRFWRDRRLAAIASSRVT